MNTSDTQTPAIEAFNLTKVYGSGNAEVVAMNDVLDYLGVADRAGNLPDALSGRQQQVAVARALANSPSLLLADEPTAALGSQRGRLVMVLFRRVAHEQGAGCLS